MDALDQRHRAPQFLNGLLDRCLTPNAEALAQIAARGDVAVAIFELAPEAIDTATILGWNGRSPVFRLSRTRARRIADQAGGVFGRWLTRRQTGGRVFMLTGRGSLLLNCTEDGWSIEHGSLDSEAN